MIEAPPHPFPTETPEGVPIPRFTPWRGARRRGSGWTPEAQHLFIAALTRLGCVAAAAEAAGRSPRSAYRLRDKPGAESFAAAWASAIGAGRSAAQQVAIARGLHGALVPQFRDGHFIGYRIARDDRLLIAALGAGRLAAPMDSERARLEAWEVSLRQRELDLIGGDIPRNEAMLDNEIYAQELRRIERARRTARVRAAARAAYAAQEAADRQAAEDARLASIGVRRL